MYGSVRTDWYGHEVQKSVVSEFGLKRIFPQVASFLKVKCGDEWSGSLLQIG